MNRSALPRFFRRSLALPLAPLLLFGCVHTEVTLVSQHTALERQAAGEYPDEERALQSESVRPGPEAIPREQLIGTGEGGELGVVAEMAAQAAGDDERIEALAARGCVGEALTGFLQSRLTECEATDVDPDELTRLITRVNLHRRQAWEFLHEESGASVDEARAAWRVRHLERVACGTWVEVEAERWGAQGVPTVRWWRLILMLATLGATWIGGWRSARAQLDGREDVLALRMPTRLTAGAGDQLMGVLSPAGDALYFVGGEHGTAEVLVQAPLSAAPATCVRRARRPRLPTRQPRRRSLGLYLVRAGREGRRLRAPPTPRR